MSSLDRRAWLSIVRWIATVGFVGAGLNHFRVPETYAAMIPDVLPAPMALNYISGIAEILGGIGLIFAASRRIAAWGLIVLLVAVFPANINMAINNLPLGADPVPAWALWGRLPLQLVFIAWCYLFTRREPA